MAHAVLARWALAPFYERELLTPRFVDYFVVVNQPSGGALSCENLIRLANTKKKRCSANLFDYFAISQSCERPAHNLVTNPAQAI